MQAHVCRWEEFFKSLIYITQKWFPKATPWHSDYDPGTGNSLLVSARKALISSKGRNSTDENADYLLSNLLPQTQQYAAQRRWELALPNSPMRWTEGLQQSELAQRLDLAQWERDFVTPWERALRPRRLLLPSSDLTRPHLASLMVVWQLTVWAKRKHTLTKELRGRI